jgi:hypothetical protein
VATQAYYDWVNDGRPWRNAVPINDFAARLRSQGYTVYTIGSDDSEHLQSSYPEDHCPFSFSAWPWPQPYPEVMALDIMPGGPVDWRDLAARISADKSAGKQGTEWIKYMNWTDRGGSIWHDSWMPWFARTGSSDGGHIHISGRTDYHNAHTSYDPVNDILHPNQSGDAMQNFVTSSVPVKEGFAEYNEDGTPRGAAGYRDECMTVIPLPSTAFGYTAYNQWTKFFADRPGSPFSKAQLRVAIRVESNTGGPPGWDVRTVVVDATQAPKTLSLPKGACGLSICRQPMGADDEGLMGITTITSYEL